MYETGVLVENPIAAAEYFRNRMGYKNPDSQATNLVTSINYGFQGNWRGQTYDKREYIAGVHNGDMPGADTNTDVLQARAMDPWSEKAKSRLDYINPSWQANVSEFGGHSGTIEMLAGGHDRPLPMAMDNLEQISANALDENQRKSKNDPLSSSYALVHMGLNELLANDRAQRLAEHRGQAGQGRDVTMDLSKSDMENTYNTSYQGPNMPHRQGLQLNPHFQRIQLQRELISNIKQAKISKNFSEIYRPEGTIVQTPGQAQHQAQSMRRRAENAFHFDQDTKIHEQMNMEFNEKRSQKRYKRGMERLERAVTESETGPGMLFSKAEQQYNLLESIRERGRKVKGHIIQESASALPINSLERITPQKLKNSRNEFMTPPPKEARTRLPPQRFSPGEDLYDIPKKSKKK